MVNVAYSVQLINDEARPEAQSPSARPPLSSLPCKVVDVPDRHTAAGKE